RGPAVAGSRWPVGSEIDTVAGARETAVLIDGGLEAGDAVVTEHATGRSFTVAASGFWQGHPAAADTLVAAVLAGLDPQPGERVLDLYCGVGLFAAALADRGCRVWGVEADRTAVEHARRNVPEARFTAARVERALKTGSSTRSSPRSRTSKGRTALPRRNDLVLLDPPRSGAGRPVIEGVAARRPRAICYVACDPAALARDLGYAAELGYAPTSVRAFDLFPMTHHVECVAILQRRP
ncbi:MAG TPA: methyltransferase domain-containing protein, partial [Microlunatus sp.]